MNEYMDIVGMIHFFATKYGFVWFETWHDSDVMIPTAPLAPRFRLFLLASTSASASVTSV